MGDKTFTTLRERIEAVVGHALIVGEVARLAEAWGTTIEVAVAVLDIDLADLDVCLAPEVYEVFGVTFAELL